MERGIMRKAGFCFMSYLLGAYMALAQETVVQELDQQFRILSAEIESWKKEVVKKQILQVDNTRQIMEKLLLEGIAFQKSYTAETDSITKSDLLDEYLVKRDAARDRLPVLLSHIISGKNAYPIGLSFEKDRLELDAKRPFIMKRNARLKETWTSEMAKNPLFFSYAESRRFANLLSVFIARAESGKTASVSTRDFTVFVQKVDNETGIFIQFKTPSGELNPKRFELSEFDAKLLADRITKALDKSPPSVNYREPDNLDPATAPFDTPEAEKTSALFEAGKNSASSLTLDASRIKVSQGKVDDKTKMKVQQQFDYRVSLRWRGEGTINVQTFMYLVSPVNNKLAIVGMAMKDVTIESGPVQELLIDAKQKVPGPMAGTVIIQCFSHGQLLKGFSSSVQHKRFADMDDIESQLTPLYRDPAYNK